MFFHIKHFHFFIFFLSSTTLGSFLRFGSTVECWTTSPSSSSSLLVCFGLFVTTTVPSQCMGVFEERISESRYLAEERSSKWHEDTTSTKVGVVIDEARSSFEAYPTSFVNFTCSYLSDHFCNHCYHCL